MPLPLVLASLAPVAAKILGSAAGAAATQAIGKGVGKVGQMLGQSKANKLKKQAESLFPQYEDPRQLAQLARLQQMQKSLETGAEFQGAKDTAMQNIAGTQAGIVKSTGGDVGSTIQGLLQAQRVGGQQLNQAYAQAEQRQAALNPLVTSLNNLISSRKMELQLAKSQQKLAEWAKMQQQLNQNLGAGAARAGAMAGLKQGKPSMPLGGFNVKNILSGGGQGASQAGQGILQGAIGGMENIGGDLGIE